jgi:hypothetical protein
VSAAEADRILISSCSLNFSCSANVAAINGGNAAFKILKIKLESHFLHLVTPLGPEITGSLSLLLGLLNLDANPAKKLLLLPLGTFGSKEGEEADFGGIFNAANGVGVGSCPLTQITNFTMILLLSMIWEQGQVFEIYLLILLQTDLFL